MKTRNHSFVNDIVRSAIWFNQLQENSVAMVDCTSHFKENKSTSFQNQIFRSYNEDMEEILGLQIWTPQITTPPFTPPSLELLIEYLGIAETLAA